MPRVEPSSNVAQSDPKITGLTQVDRMSRWLTLGANIGVILGLIILIVEVRQNAAISRAAMEMQANTELREIELSLSRPEVSEVFMKSVQSPETLTDAEIRLMDGVLVSILLQVDQRFLIAKQGIGTEVRAREHLHNTIPFYFGSRFGKQWWAQQSAGWEGSESIRLGTPILAAVDDNYMADYYANLRVAPAPKPSPDIEDTP